MTSRGDHLAAALISASRGVRRRRVAIVGETLRTDQVDFRSLFFFRAAAFCF